MNLMKSLATLVAIVFALLIGVAGPVQATEKAKSEVTQVKDMDRGEVDSWVQQRSERFGRLASRGRALPTTEKLDTRAPRHAEVKITDDTEQKSEVKKGKKDRGDRKYFKKGKKARKEKNLNKKERKDKKYKKDRKKDKNEKKLKKNKKDRKKKHTRKSKKQKKEGVSSSSECQGTCSPEMKAACETQGNQCVCGQCVKK